MDRLTSALPQDNPYFDKDRICQTPGAVFATTISARLVCVSVAMPFPLLLNEKASMKLEHDLHIAVESVMKEYFK